MLRVADIVDQTDIPESSIRRYLKQFNDFVVCKQSGRAIMYAAETVPLMNRVVALYNEGKSTTEIYDILRYEVPIVTEPISSADERIEPVETMETSLVSCEYPPGEQLQELQCQIQGFVDVLEAVLTKTQRIDQHDDTIQLLQRDLIDAKVEFNQYVTRFTELDQMSHHQSTIDTKLEATRDEIRQNTMIIQQQDEKIASLRQELELLRKSQPVPFLTKLKRVFQTGSGSSLEKVE